MKVILKYNFFKYLILDFLEFAYVSCIDQIPGYIPNKNIYFLIIFPKQIYCILIIHINMHKQVVSFLFILQLVQNERAQPNRYLQRSCFQLNYLTSVSCEGMLIQFSTSSEVRTSIKGRMVQVLILRPFFMIKVKGDPLVQQSLRIQENQVSLAGNYCVFIPIYK